MRHTVSAVLCALLCLVAVPALAASADAPVAVSPADAPQVEITAQETVPTVDVEGACESPLLDAQPASSCPFGAPTCRRHDDCDAYCGDPRFGYCSQQGHFPTGCCTCTG